MEEAKLPVRIFTKPVLSIVLVLLILLNAPANADEEALIVVNDFHATLLQVMQQGVALDFTARQHLLREAIDSSFDMQMIGNVVLNRHWRELTDDQRAQFVTAFLDLSSATYASRFDDLSDQVFEPLGITEMNGGRLMVRTEISGPNMGTVSLDYILHKPDTEWLIISAIADGVNDLALKRAEYTAIMNNAGFDALISDLQAQIANLVANYR